MSLEDDEYARLLGQLRAHPAHADVVERVVDARRLAYGAELSERPTAAELLRAPEALLTRSHLRELGLGRAAIDAIFRELDVVVFPGLTRPHVRAADDLALVERSTYGDDRVRIT